MMMFDDAFYNAVNAELYAFVMLIVNGSHVMLSDIASYIIKEPEREALMSVD